MLFLHTFFGQTRRIKQRAIVPCAQGLWLGCRAITQVGYVLCSMVEHVVLLQFSHALEGREEWRDQHAQEVGLHLRRGAEKPFFILVVHASDLRRWIKYCFQTMCTLHTHHLPSVDQRQGMVLEKTTTDDEQEERCNNLQAIGTVGARLARHRLCGTELDIDRGSPRCQPPRTQCLKRFTSNTIIVSKPVMYKMVCIM